MVADDAHVHGNYAANIFRRTDTDTQCNAGDPGAINITIIACVCVVCTYQLGPSQRASAATAECIHRHVGNAFRTVLRTDYANLRAPMNEMEMDANVRTVCALAIRCASTHTRSKVNVIAIRCVRADCTQNM